MPDVVVLDRKQWAEVSEELTTLRAKVRELAGDKSRRLLLQDLEAAEAKVQELSEGMVCADCNDTGWLENRVDGRYPCTCMTEAEPYRLLEARVRELDERLTSSRNINSTLVRNFKKTESRLTALLEGLEELIKSCNE